MKSKQTVIKSSIIVLMLVIFDQVTKYFATIKLKANDAYVIINDVFELQYLENESAAFSLDPVSIIHHFFPIKVFDENPALFLKTKMIFFIVLTAICIFLLIKLYLRIPDIKRYMVLNGVIIDLVAGALGNLIDRIIHNYVIDFFYFSLINFPIFNVADNYVSCSVFVLAYLILFFLKEDDFEKIFPSKKKNESKGK